MATRDVLLKNLKANLEVARNRMKQMADRGRIDVTFQEGEMVFLELQPYRQQSAFRRVHQKLTSKYFGPYPIKERVGAVAYKLKLPNGVRPRLVFHVSQLRKKLGEGFLTSLELPPTNRKIGFTDTNLVPVITFTDTY